MEKVAWIALLLDFYGQLLTERQQKFLDLYYGDDLSLGEIAEFFNVSRQAVYDTLKRAENLLFEYEDKLKLVAKFLIMRKKLAEAVNLLEESEAGREDENVIQARAILCDLVEMVIRQ